VKSHEVSGNAEVVKDAHQAVVCVWWDGEPGEVVAFEPQQSQDGSLWAGRV
jgi:uncharacterized protein YodC (DUF2158 family)